MNRSKVVSLKNINAFDFIIKNKTILILCLVFAIGVVLGTFSFSKSERAVEIAENSFSSFLMHRQQQSFFAVAFSSFVSSSLIMLVCFLCGASLLGMVLVPLLICWRGFWYGNISALLYATYALKGVAFNAIILVPPMLFSLISLLFAARESIAFSTVLSGLTLPKSRPLNLHIDFKNYCGRYLLLTAALLLSAIIDSVLSCSFLHFFSFS